MNPSRLFILRPVATALLDGGHSPGRRHRLSPVAGVGAAPSRLPDHPGADVLSRREPGRHGVFGHGAARAPVRADARPEADDLHQFRRQLRHHACSSASDLGLDVAEQEVQAAINAAATFLPRDLPNPPVYSKVNPADAPILTLALTSDTLPLPQVEDLAETRFAQKISQLPGVGLVSISGGQRPAVRIQANPPALAAYGLTLEDLRIAVGAANVNQAKGGFDGPRRASIIDANDQLLPSTRISAARSSPIATARRSICRTWPMSSTTWKTPAGGLDERRRRR